jgi:hypothetical protein
MKNKNERATIKQHQRNKLQMMTNKSNLDCLIFEFLNFLLLYLLEVVHHQHLVTVNLS